MPCTKQLLLNHIEKDRVRALRKASRALEDFDLCDSKMCVEKAKHILRTPFEGLIESVEQGWKEMPFQLEAMVFDEMVWTLYMAYISTVRTTLDLMESQGVNGVGQCIAILFTKLVLKTLVESAEALEEKHVNG